MPEILTENRTVVECPNCGTPIYQYNQHACAECGAQVCYYCESTHHTDKHAEVKDGKISE